MNEKNEKIKYLIEIKNLEQKGFIPSTYYTINSKLEDIILEYKILNNQYNIKIKEKLLKEIEKLKKESVYEYKDITIDMDIEIIKKIHESLKNENELNKKQKDLIDKVFLADKLLEEKYNMSFIKKIKEEFNK